MVVLLVLLTFGLFIAVDVLIRARRKHATAPQPAIADAVAVLDRPGERLFHPGHCWVQLVQPGLATIGADNFAQHVLGRAEAIEIPNVPRQVRQGEPLVTLRRGTRSLTLVAPVSGKVAAVNTELSSHPDLVNDSPYEKGWIVQLVPQNFAFEIRNLIHGITASLWREALRTQLMQWFTPRLGPVMQDGGHLIDNFSDMLTPDDWQKLTKEFFPDVSNR